MDQPINIAEEFPGLIPQLLRDLSIELGALTSFLDDWCIASVDQTISCGYLDGLKSLLAQVDPSSNLAQASRIMGLVNLGKKLGRPEFVNKARELYPGLLSSFQETLANPKISRTTESLATAVLLGIYEVGLQSSLDY